MDADTIVATLKDPEAKAWRLVVSGTGELGGDRWEIVVETGDIGPVITATEIRGGEVADVLDLTGFYDGTAAAGGCHSTLPVCLDSDGFRVPEGDGLFSVRLDLPEAQVAPRDPRRDRHVGRRAVRAGSLARHRGVRLGRGVAPGTSLADTMTPASIEAGVPIPRCWWAGAESNCHSRRRGFYRPLGSPPAQPTHEWWR